MHQAQRGENESDSTVLYRLPGGDVCQKLTGRPLALVRLGDIGDRDGFVFAPFDTSPDLPILFFPGEAEPYAPIARRPAPPTAAATLPLEESSDYKSDFLSMHRLLTGGDVRKVVLAHTYDILADLRAHDALLFAEACRAYPDAFVSMVRTPHCGTWLTASPEVLIEQNGGEMRTMALAGTMRAGDGESPAWDAKNVAEQGIVSQYIEEELTPLAETLRKSGRKTVSSGDLRHLQTTFTFRPLRGVTLWDVASRLHPTPAVCGMPQAAALAAIRRTEAVPREYYSGFAGPVRPDGRASLFVNIRCMKMTADRCRLYAGGGLMPDSDADDEEREIAAKADVMKRLAGCIATNRQ